MTTAHASPQYTALLEGAVEIAHRAGTAILEIYASGDMETSTKADDSPLTRADLRAHRLIVDSLRALTPDIPLISEESTSLPSYSQRSRWDRYWLIDPLDGTKEFVSRNGEFTVNIALIENHAPTLGVVHVPVRATTYTGMPGSGAWRIDGNGTSEPLRVQMQAHTPVRVVGSKSHRGDSLDGFLANLGPHKFVPIGSSLKFCMVAEGAADVYPRFGPTSEWDTAAAQAVVCAAGGAVVTLDGAPLTYNTKPEVLNPHFLVYADRGRDWLRYCRVNERPD